MDKVSRSLRSDPTGAERHAWFPVETTLQRVVLLLIRLYQIGVSPLLGNHCRFEPSCSTYVTQAIERYGLVRGIWRGLHRIARCHPLHPGGYDPVV
jgi:putative membrane protein insertion efficiency factor